MIKIVIKDVEYTLDEAKALYEELATLFGKLNDQQSTRPTHAPNTQPFPGPCYPDITTPGWKTSPQSHMIAHNNWTPRPLSEWLPK